MDGKKVLVPQKANIFTFKSIYGDTAIPLTPNIHFLIGANGAGKSTLLEVLSLIGNDSKIPPKWIPKFLTLSGQKELLDKADETVILKVEFKASPELFGSASSDDANGIDTIYFSLFASGKRIFKSNLGDLPEKNTRYLDRHSESFDSLYELLNALAEGKHGGNQQIYQLASSCFKAEERNITLQNIQKLLSVCKQTLPSVANDLQEKIDTYSKFKELHNNPPDWVNDITSAVPHVTFIPPRYELPDSFTIEDVANATEGTFLSARKLLKLSGITPESLEGLGDNDIQHAMHQASELLTKSIKKNWHQEKLEIKLAMNDKETLTLTVHDSTGAFISPSECSEGLKWFLPFYINLAVDLGEEWKNGIILIDDPGVYLHPEAQKDVRTLLQKLSKDNTVVVCTHSPFILDTTETSSIHVVKKLDGKRTQQGKGTSVASPKESGWEDKAVIRAAIGLTIGDTLFGNKISFIVEGHSDRIYIESILKLPDIDKRIGIKADDIGVLNAMGADKVEFYANWCNTENRKYCVILDNDSKGRGRLERLKELELGNYTLLIDSQFTRDDVNGDSSVEDIISKKDFESLVSNGYATYKYKPEEILRAFSKQPTGIMNVTRAEKALTEITAKKKGVDKISIANKFACAIEEPENEDNTISISGETIDRFRDVIKEAIKKANLP